jgi:hypothetical protein
VFAHTGVEFELARVNKNDPSWMESYRSNKEFDIRVAGVSIGGSFQNWVINMMFCSRLGVSFPDPSGRICRLTVDFEEGKVNLVDYGIHFNNAIHSDQAVIPLFHRRYSWFVSHELDVELSPVSGSPRFDLIRLK